MGPTRIGTSPARADAMLHAALAALEAKGALVGQLGCVETLMTFLPSHYLPDVWLEQPLLGAGEPRAAFVLCNVERNYLNRQSDGTYLKAAGVPAALAQEDHDIVSGLVATGADVSPFTLRDTSIDVRDLSDGDLLAGFCAQHGLGQVGEGGPAALLRRLAESGIAGRVLVRGGQKSCELVFCPTKTDARATFARAPYRDVVRDLLFSLGSDRARVDSLDDLSATCAVSGFCVAEGMCERAVLADVGCFAVRWVDGGLAGVSAGVLVTDRIATEGGRALKPGIAYQWHITDECDQRCKHCYLFAEDARMRCVSTPWDQLMRTLDEAERSAERRGGMLEFAVTGGDPILHPRFWDLAAELHRRGIEWSAMGNPFHLNDEVCRRLRALGCYQYQMSLDGLEPFHDHLRKPGSFRATLAALAPLNVAGIQTQLMATASRQNLSDILACMDLAAQYGASSFSFARYCATSPQKAAELYPTAAEYREFLLAYHTKKQAYEHTGCRTRFKEKDHLFTLLRWELGEFEVPAWSAAQSGRICAGCHLGAKCTIAANGDLLACRRMGSVVGNIRTQGLFETDTSPAMAAYADPSRIAKCKDCELVAWCRGCRAVGFNATGDLQAADPMCWHE